VDAGNFADPGETPAVWETQHWEKTLFAWDVMAKLKYDVVTPGDLELLEGAQVMKDLFARHPEIQVVSANVQDKSGKFIFPRYTIIERNGIRFGVTGVTGKTYYDFNVKKGKQKKDDFVVLDSKDALKDVVAELRPKVDILVALVHEGVGDCKRLLGDTQGAAIAEGSGEKPKGKEEGIQDIDVMVVGHFPNYMFNPDRTGKTLILLGGTKGQYLSVLNLTLDDSGKKILDYNGEGKPLGDEVAKEQTIDAEVKAWEAAYKKHEETAKREKAAKDASTQGTEKYVGAEVCGRCHADIYSRWARTPHAKAWDTLAKAGKQDSEECLKCHVVGYGEQSGYALTALTDRLGKSVSTTDTSSLRNVQCEACHGMGTFHGTDMMVKVTPEETCRNCHAGEYEANFDYSQALSKGLIH
jgi:hypothetical protein